MTRRSSLPMGVAGDALGGAGTVHRLPLNRRAILTGAVTLIDQSDLAHLTMRRLGAAMGVEGMTLYGYVHSREDLLDGVVDLMVEDLADPPDTVPAGHWPDYLRSLAHGVRSIALAHPQVFPLLATRTTIAPWVRPPIRSLRWTEALLDMLHRSGFTDTSVVTAYRAFTSFLLGHLLPEVAAAGVDITPARYPGPVFDPWSHPDPVNYPQLSRLWPELGRDHSSAEFDEALTALVHRLRILRTNPPGPRCAGPDRGHRYRMIPWSPPGDEGSTSASPFLEGVPPMTTPDATTHPGVEPVDAAAVDRVRAVQDTTGVAGTDTEILPAAASESPQERYLTRSEEQLHVETQRVAVGRARLEKFVVTEEQTITVSVSHDEVRLVREPIPDGTALEDLPAADGVPEIILTEERVVVTKVVVPVERVRLENETVTEQRDVTETVRKEQIELDGHPDHGPDRGGVSQIV